jgi:hypothetical protein
VSDVIVFFKKPTTALGNLALASEWYEVTQFRGVVIQTLMTGVIGSPTAVDLTLQGSSDMDQTETLDGPDTLTLNTMNNMSVTAPPRYIRMVVQATGGTNPGFTLWSKGVARES